MVALSFLHVDPVNRAAAKFDLRCTAVYVNEGKMAPGARPEHARPDEGLKRDGLVLLSLERAASRERTVRAFGDTA
jgi:hypothetical protein